MENNTIMGLLICIHYETPSIWPGILRIMSFKGLTAIIFGKVIDGELQAGTTIWEVFELHFRKGHLKHRWSNVPIQGLTLRFKKSILIHLIAERAAGV